MLHLKYFLSLIVDGYFWGKKTPPNYETIMILDIEVVISIALYIYCM